MSLFVFFFFKQKTAYEMRISDWSSDVCSSDLNGQAAAKYLAMIRRNFFNSPQLNERERMAFVLAGYNMGPQRVQSMRAEARRRGLNPNQWFFQEIGRASCRERVCQYV